MVWRPRIVRSARQQPGHPNVRAALCHFVLCKVPPPRSPPKKARGGAGRCRSLTAARASGGLEGGSAHLLRGALHPVPKAGGHHGDELLGAGAVVEPAAAVGGHDLPVAVQPQIMDCPLQRLGDGLCGAFPHPAVQAVPDHLHLGHDGLIPPGLLNGHAEKAGALPALAAAHVQNGVLYVLHENHSYEWEFWIL